jgi:NAD(P)-dependent dehydrogenase (short-subunit alcohol dehydrogenase family)
MREFKSKVAVITGAASGIGYGIAERCAREGMRIVLADIERGALTKAERNIKATGAEVLAVRTDVSKSKDVEALSQKTLDAFGAVHLLFNNAGVGPGWTTWGSSLADWQWILGVNLWGVIYGVHFFVPIMLKQDTECHIVNTASVGGLLAIAGTAPYAVSKHGVVALSETLYRELVLGGYKVGVSVLCPGLIKTNIVECSRNRPGELQNKPGEGMDTPDSGIQAARHRTKQGVEKGMPPPQLAEIVFDAIRENKFYVLPNADLFRPMIRARLEDIAQERNPTAVP